MNCTMTSQVSMCQVTFVFLISRLSIYKQCLHLPVYSSTVTLYCHGRNNDLIRMYTLAFMHHQLSLQLPAKETHAELVQNCAYWILTVSCLCGYHICKSYRSPLQLGNFIFLAKVLQAQPLTGCFLLKGTFKILTD